MPITGKRQEALQGSATGNEREQVRPERPRILTDFIPTSDTSAPFQGAPSIDHHAKGRNAVTASPPSRGAGPMSGASSGARPMAAWRLGDASATGAAVPTTTGWIGAGPHHPQQQLGTPLSSAVSSASHATLFSERSALLSSSTHTSSSSFRQLDNVAEQPSMRLPSGASRNGSSSSSGALASPWTSNGPRRLSSMQFGWRPISSDGLLEITAQELAQLGIQGLIPRAATSSQFSSVAHPLAEEGSPSRVLGATTGASITPPSRRESAAAGGASARPVKLSTTSTSALLVDALGSREEQANHRDRQSGGPLPRQHSKSHGAVGDPPSSTDQLPLTPSKPGAGSGLSLQARTKISSSEPIVDTRATTPPSWASPGPSSSSSLSPQVRSLGVATSESPRRAAAELPRLPAGAGSAGTSPARLGRGSLNGWDHPFGSSPSSALAAPISPSVIQRDEVVERTLQDLAISDQHPGADAIIGDPRGGAPQTSGLLPPYAQRTTISQTDPSAPSSLHTDFCESPTILRPSINFDDLALQKPPRVQSFERPTSDAQPHTTRDRPPLFIVDVRVGARAEAPSVISLDPARLLAANAAVPGPLSIPDLSACAHDDMAKRKLSQVAEHLELARKYASHEQEPPVALMLRSIHPTAATPLAGTAAPTKEDRDAATLSVSLQASEVVQTALRHSSPGISIFALREPSTENHQATQEWAAILGVAETKLDLPVAHVVPPTPALSSPPSLQEPSSFREARAISRSETIKALSTYSMAAESSSLSPAASPVPRGATLSPTASPAPRSSTLSPAPSATLSSLGSSPRRPMLARLDTSERIKTLSVATDNSRPRLAGRGASTSPKLSIDTLSRPSTASSSRATPEKSPRTASPVARLAIPQRLPTTPLLGSAITASNPLAEQADALTRDRRGSAPPSACSPRLDDNLALPELSPTYPGRSMSVSTGTAIESDFIVSEILPGFLYLGPDCATTSELEHLTSTLGIRRILNCAVEIEEGGGKHLALHVGGQGIERYKKLDMADDVEAEGVQRHIEAACSFLDDARLHSAPTYVHCKAGKSRSVMIVMAYLISAFNWSLRRAYGYVVSRRKTVSPNIGFVAELMRFEARRREGSRMAVNEDPDQDTPRPSVASPGLTPEMAALQSQQRGGRARESMPPLLPSAASSSPHADSFSPSSTHDVDGYATSHLSSLPEPRSATFSSETKGFDGRYRPHQAPADDVTLVPPRRQSIAALERT